MDFLKENYQKIWQAIIRPPRYQYLAQDLGKLLKIGPNVMHFHKFKVQRTDLDITNKRGQVLKCSHFQPLPRKAKQLPCIIYLHANASSRLQGMRYIKDILQMNITLFVFDFAGCGLSQGQFISLGWYQCQDVQIIVEHLRNTKTVSTIALSMGANTALMYSDKDPSISALVLDSPFTDLMTVAQHLAKKQANVPNFLTSIALKMVGSTIKQKNNFDITKLNPLKNHVEHAHIPAYFLHGIQDDFIQKKHSQKLYQKYGGSEKRLKLFEGYIIIKKKPQFDQTTVYNRLYIDFFI